MFNLNPIVYLLLLLIPLSGCSTSDTSSNTNAQLTQKQFVQQYPELDTKLENKVQQIFSEDSLQGDFLIAIVNGDGLVYSYALNRDILSGRPSNLDNNSPIYVASHTKAFTGTLAAQLEEEGIIHLDSSLHKYLPELTYRDSVDTQNIKIQQLLNHTHGTFSTLLTWKTAFLGYGGTDVELIHDINNDFLVDPSHRFRYSNVGPIIASLVVDKVTRHSWKKEMATHIFKPLGMNHTSTKVSDYAFNGIRPSVTVSHNKIVETGFYKEDITMHAAGGIISTINDLAKWLQANINEDDRLLTKSGWAKLHKPTTEQNRTYFTYHRTGYSLGWDIAQYEDDTLLTRFGSMAGITFHMSFIPARNVGVIGFTSDSRDFYLSSLMANYVYNMMFRKDSAELIFEKEKQIYKEGFTEYANEPSPILDNELLAINDQNDQKQGIYKSADNWPEIAIQRNDTSYAFQWGALKGAIYKENDGFIVPLGPLDRLFSIQNDTLKTGSLVFIKEKE